MSRHVFCRTLALERGEPHEGTGHFAERVLMLAWPKGKWRVPRFESADMSPALGEALRRAMQSDLSDNTVELVEGSAGQRLPTLFAYPEARTAEPGDEAELVALIEAWTDGTAFAGPPDDRITILCCTDAKRDACCARFGFATYKALVAAADPDRFNVVQSTHLGGCRFAASLVVMPGSRRYGRLTPEEVPAFLAALDAGETYLPASRGNPALDEPAQAAELAVMRWGTARGESQAGIRLTGRRMDGPETITFYAACGPLPVRVSVSARSFPIDGACSAIGIEPPEIETRWVAGTVAPLAEPGMDR